jgi:hypothetical protein
LTVSARLNLGLSRTKFSPPTLSSHNQMLCYGTALG